ncbi:MAG: aminopeptidase [Candidatus Marinimicrobia bacterium]|nr:aminopeptidase [Candidatus Neomarinimicrobiota bacterium]
MRTKRIFWIVILCISTRLHSENDTTKTTFQYEFKTLTEIPATTVKDQGKSGTCWSYATISFLESEVLRNTGEKVDLAEMFFVRNTYLNKAKKYVRLHGANTFAEGGQSHDVIDIMQTEGALPQESYNGFEIDGEVDHKEISKVTKAFLDAVVDSRYLTTKWFDAFTALMDTYLGKIPQDFQYKGKTYTPESFLSDYLKIDPNDYVELTSYTNYPFYEKCCLEVPDNWSYNCNYLNIPIDELELVVDQALEKGYSVCWDADVSEDYWTPDTLDIALLPTKAYNDTIEDQWDKKIKGFVEEIEVDQELRQQTFDTYQTTDDHLMHLVGLAEDQQGNKFYKIKNSWGNEDHQYDGYYYISKPYFRLKTLCLMVHKDAIPKKILKKFKK